MRKTLYETPLASPDNYEPEGPYIVTIWDEAWYDLLAAYECDTFDEAVETFHRFAMPPVRGRFTALLDAHRRIVLGWTDTELAREFIGMPVALDRLERCYPDDDDTMVVWRAAARGELQDIGWNTYR